MALEEKKKLVHGYKTEYADNYVWGESDTNATSWNKESSGLFDGNIPAAADFLQSGAPGAYLGGATGGAPDTDFHSTQYPSVYRETVVHKDDRGSYINPYVGLSSKPCGRRLMYDKTHPMKMYASQWSSELADTAGCYSFPTTTGLDPEQPWKKDMTWRLEGEEGHWPTDAWKQWTQVAQCPPYDGHSDQPEYSLYKVQVP